MDSFDLIKLMPDDENFALFADFSTQMYPPDSFRHKLGHDPAAKHLEGCYVLTLGGTPLGRFALYTNPDLKYEGKAAACIGSYECTHNATLAKVLLDSAKLEAKDLGFEYLIGPMEGSTWNSYRFSLHNNYPNFFMEPYHHDYYAAQFEEEGFDVIGTYASMLSSELTSDLKSQKDIEEKAKEIGTIFRQMNADDFEAEIRRIGEFSIDSFQDNFLYTPISIDEFATKYIPLKAYMKPELIWLAEDVNGKVDALAFAIPDYFDPTGKTFIIKTLARRQNSPLKGVGSYLADKVTESARGLGFTKVIHALMLTDNASVKISGDFAGKAYKSYHLYGVNL